MCAMFASLPHCVQHIELHIRHKKFFAFPMFRKTKVRMANTGNLAVTYKSHLHTYAVLAAAAPQSRCVCVLLFVPTHRICGLIPSQIVQHTSISCLFRNYNECPDVCARKAVAASTITWVKRKRFDGERFPSKPVDLCRRTTLTKDRQEETNREQVAVTVLLIKLYSNDVELVIYVPAALPSRIGLSTDTFLTIT